MYPDFDDLLKRRADAQGALESEAPFARINPYSVQKGILGNTTIVASCNGAQIPTSSSAVDPTTGAELRGFISVPRKAPVAWWEGDNIETTPVTITFGIKDPVFRTPLITDPGSVPLFPPTVGIKPNDWAMRPYGIIRFGTKGALQEAEVDIETGVQFTVNAAMVTLEVTQEPDANQQEADGTIPPAGTSLPGTPGIMTLSGMISFFPCVKATSATRTRYYDLAIVGPGSSPIFTVPAFSKNLSIWRDPAVAMSVDFMQADGTVSYTYVIPINTFDLTPIPISGDIYFVRANAIAGGTVNKLRLIFGLSF